jgi:hypothetical protein
VEDMQFAIGAVVLMTLLVISALLPVPPML